MKYLRQLLMILIFSFIGEVLHAVIPIQMPASIYGLVLLFIALMTGMVKLPQVHEAARFLIEIMPLMFIPAGVGLIDSWGRYEKPNLQICFRTEKALSFLHFEGSEKL